MQLNFTQPEPVIRTYIAELSTYFHAFIALLLFTFIISTFTLIAAFFSNVKRQLTWYNVIISIPVFCVSYLLLFFDRGKIYHPPPSYGVCIVQAGLVQAAPILTITSVLGLMLELWLTTRISIFPESSRLKSIKRYMIVVSILPYIIFVAIFLAAFIPMLAHPQHQIDLFMVCSTALGAPVQVLALVLLGIALVLLAFIFQTLYIHARSTDAGRNNIRQYKNSFIRMSMIMCVIIVALVIIAALPFRSGSDTYEAIVRASISVGIVAASVILILGYQKDLVEAWISILKWPWTRRTVQQRAIPLAAANGSSPSGSRQENQYGFSNRMQFSMKEEGPSS